MRKLVYRTTGPLLGAAIVFRLIFCPADLCAHTMADHSGAETQATENQSAANIMSMESPASRGDEQPCHGKESEKQSDSNTGASCCNNETVTDAPNLPVLSITEVFLERVSATVIQPLELSIYAEESVDHRYGPPDGLRIHLKNQTFLN